MKNLIYTILISLLAGNVFAQETPIETAVKEFLKPLIIKSYHLDPDHSGMTISGDVVPFGVGDLVFDGIVFIPRNPKGSAQPGFDDKDNPLGGLAFAIKDANTGKLECPTNAIAYRKHRVPNEEIVMGRVYCLKNRAGTHYGLIRFDSITNEEIKLSVRMRVDLDNTPILDPVDPATNALILDELPQEQTQQEQPKQDQVQQEQQPQQEQPTQQEPQQPQPQQDQPQQ